MSDLNARLESLRGPVIVVERTVPLAADQVWLALVDPSRLATWWWPHLSDTTYEVDARVGGRFRFYSEAAGFGCHGTYLDLVPEHSLASTFVWETGTSDSPEDLVSITLEGQGEHTALTLAHRMATEVDEAGDGEESETANLRQGWTDVLSRLG